MTTKEKPLPKSAHSLSEALAIFQSKVKSADRTGTAKETRKDKKTKYVLLNVSIQLLKMFQSNSTSTELGISHTPTFDYIPLLQNQVLTVLTKLLYISRMKNLKVNYLQKNLKVIMFMQDLGISITYTRRYALGAAYGIGSERR